MALDGVFISGLVNELNTKLLGGRIYKIYQPEVDELCIVVKSRTEDGNSTYRLVISASASLPLMYLTEQTKENPAVAPNFCMLLRKHIGNGRILDITQPGFERIVEFTIEHLDEMGDLCSKKLIVELMGKHSNIIFIDDGGKIIDSIKHISFQVSSVREVLPGRTYEYPPNHSKKNPMEVDVNYFINHIINAPDNVCKAIYTSMNGVSPVIANQIAYQAGVDGNSSCSSLNLSEKERLYEEFDKLKDIIRNAKFQPNIAYNGYEPKEFSTVLLTSYGTPVQGEMPAKGINGLKLFNSASRTIEEYYKEKSVVTRIKQRSVDLRKIVANAIDRTRKKYDLQLMQLKDTEKREKYRIYGELLTAYAYSINKGDGQVTCDNYYTNEPITIPLDRDLSPMDNANKYYARYNKLKRTYEALAELTLDSKAELDYLMSVQNFLELATMESDLEQIKTELVESGYIRGRSERLKGKKTIKNKPLHYISSDGYHMYVGKNNLQNDELTFKMAEGKDMWFHAKQMPGSHVIVKVEGDKELPDRTYEEAARLAAYYSVGKTNPKVDVDYTERKHIKKPPKAKPGYVIYHTNYSMTIEPDIRGIQHIQ